MGCATGMVKYLVFIANLVFALAGLALVIIGIMYKLNYNAATSALPNDFGLAPILSIVIGAIVFVTAFLGCCGAVKESPCMLTTYAIILLTIFIIQVAIGVYAFIQIKDTDEFHRAIRNNLQKTFDRYRTDDEAAKEAVDVVQRFLECCGVDSSDEMRLPNQSLPLSCCKKDVPHCRTTDNNIINHTGCAQALFVFLESSSQVVGGVTIGIAVLELICCGMDGPDSFPQITLPQSCCDENVRDCSRSSGSGLHRDGCAYKLQSFLEKSSQAIGGVVIGIAAIEILGAFFGLCLASSIRNHYRRNIYA